MSDSILYDVIRDGVTALASASVVWYATWRKSLKHYQPTTAEIVKESEINFRVQEHLAVLKERVGGIRAFIIRLHNGEEFMGRQPFTRKSRTHEVVSDGYIPQRDRYDGIPVTLVPDEMKLITDEGASFVWTKDLITGTTFWNICITGRTGATCRIALKKDGKIVAALGVDWDKDRDEKPGNLEEVVYCAQRIEALLFLS